VDPAVAALIGTLGGTALGGALSFLQYRSQRSAERERLTLQLAHERGMDDRAYLRKTIEDTMDRYDETLNALFELKAAVTVPNPEAGLSRIESRRVDVQDRIQQLFAVHRRLFLWLPHDSRFRRQWGRRQGSWSSVSRRWKALRRCLTKPIVSTRPRLKPGQRRIEPL
jgi:hypothetical protein